MFKKQKDINSLVNELVGLLNQHNLSEIEYERNGSRIKISNSKGGTVIAGGMMSSPVAASSAPAASAAAPVADLSNAFKSPMVGVVYMSAEPGAKPFIVEGQSVKKGDTLCLIEAMKTFNPVKATKDGVVKQILIKDSETVEYEQPLFIIE